MVALMLMFSNEYNICSHTGFVPIQNLSMLMSQYDYLSQTDELVYIYYFHTA